MNSRVSLIKCKSYDPSLVFPATKRAIDLLGGITSFIRPQSKVLVKPNLLMAKEPEFAITTHPEVVRSVVKILKGINCKVFIGDGPSVFGNQIENVDEVYEKTGMNRVAREEGVEIVKFEKRRWRGNFPLTTWLDECEYLVSVPKFKTHDLTTLTGAIKNLFGLIPGIYKTELHKKYFAHEDFARILVDIYREVSPALTVIDGITAMEGDGPATGGKLRNPELLFAGSDCVALDTILAIIMGLKPFEVLTNKEAANRGLGVADINNIEILGDKLEEVMEKPFKLPTTTIRTKLPRPIIEIAKKLIRFYPQVNHNNCTRCQACVQACPVKVMSMKNNRVVIKYKGCISCFCCQEACPASAIKVKKTILAKMIGL